LSVMFFDRAVDTYDEPHEFLCGDCVRCLNGCPTGAFPSPGVVDSRRCLAYQSIENRGPVPEPLRRGFVARIFGCDICQDVCPWNRFSRPHNEPRFEPHTNLEGMTRQDWQEITEEVFETVFKRSAVKRTKLAGLRRNIAFVDNSYTAPVTSGSQQ